MWYKIKKGMHRAFPLSLGIHTGKTSESYEVIFDDSCRYVPNEENDWNKLCGWSYGFLPWRKNMFPTISGSHIGETPIYEWKPAHHQNSIRIGWRYRFDLDKIEVCLYSYDKGIRKISDRTLLLDLGIQYDLFLCVESKGDKYMLCIESTGLLTLNTQKLIKPTWGYNLGLFFGGNKKSPHDMKIYIKKL